MRFPDNFQFGATLSAHAVEGGDYASDWWHWEQRPGHIADGSHSGTATQHYERWKDDLHLAHKLGLNALWISLSWPRICPEENHLDEQALAHYAAVVEELKRLHIQPWITLQEITVPRWLEQKGGWACPDSIKAFTQYVELVVKQIAPCCNHWIPMAEPEHWLQMAFLDHQWPTPSTGFKAWRASLHHLTQAHLAAVDIIRWHCKKAQVGASIRASACQPENIYSAWDFRAARRTAKRCNHRWLRLLRKQCGSTRPFDFIALSFYGRNTVRWSPRRFTGSFALYVNNQGTPATAEDTEAAPVELAPVLEALQPYHVPLVIAGNGLNTKDDALRGEFILDHLSVILNSMEHNTPVTGYFHRALLDGFEWKQGLQAHYGLVHVARESLARTPNPSAFLLKDIAENRAIRPGAVDRFCPDWKPEGDPDHVSNH